MFIEIDTTDLIAFLIKKSDFSDFILSVVKPTGL